MRDWERESALLGLWLEMVRMSAETMPLAILADVDSPLETCTHGKFGDDPCQEPPVVVLSFPLGNDEGDPTPGGIVSTPVCTRHCMALIEHMLERLEQTR